MGSDSDFQTLADSASSGLFILDVEHLPSGPGLWPAHWMVSKGKWPDNGEIDIM